LIRQRPQQKSEFVLRGVEVLKERGKKDKREETCLLNGYSSISCALKEFA